MSCGKSNVTSLYFLCCSFDGLVCRVCCVSDRVSEMFGEAIRNMFGCGCYFVVECSMWNVDGVALWDKLCMIFQIMCGLCL